MTNSCRRTRLPFPDWPVRGLTDEASSAQEQPFSDLPLPPPSVPHRSTTQQKSSLFRREGVPGVHGVRVDLAGRAGHKVRGSATSVSKPMSFVRRGEDLRVHPAHPDRTPATTAKRLVLPPLRLKRPRIDCGRLGARNRLPVFFRCRPDACDR